MFHTSLLRDILPVRMTRHRSFSLPTAGLAMHVDSCYEESFSDDDVSTLVMVVAGNNWDLSFYRHEYFNYHEFWDRLGQQTLLTLIRMCC